VNIKESAGIVDHSTKENLNILLSKLNEHNVALFSITDHNCCLFRFFQEVTVTIGLVIRITVSKVKPENFIILRLKFFPHSKDC